jgi:hypothetical protein
VYLKALGAFALAGIFALSTAASAQTSPAQSQPPTATEPSAPDVAPVPAPCCKVPALTGVELEFVDAASSRSSKAGDLVALKLAEPLVIDGRTVAAAGSKVIAEVVQASKAGLMGKAGELTFAIRYVQAGDVRIPLKRFGYGRSQGSDPSGTLNAIGVATAAAMPIASVALIFVSGGNVDIKAGALAHAVVAADTFVPSNP